MPSKKRLQDCIDSHRNSNQRLEIELLAATSRLANLEDEHDDLSNKHVKLMENMSVPLKMNAKQHDHMDLLSSNLLHHRKFIADCFGMPPQFDTDFLRQTDNGVLAYYLRPYAHYAPQLLLPDQIYTFERYCLTCGLQLPHKYAFGRCEHCQRGAWYCSRLCQNAHWPTHRFDHPPHRPDWTTPM